MSEAFFPIIPILGIIFALLFVAALLYSKKKRTHYGVYQPPEPRTPTPNPNPKADEKRNWLCAIGGRLEGKAFFLGERTVTLGRSVGNYIQLFDKGASRIHCQVTPVHHGLQVRDMNSRNGIYINGKKQQDGILRHDDKLRIGNTTFVYHVVAEFDKDDSQQPKFNTKHFVDATRTASRDDVMAMLKDALDEHGGSVSKAAESLGVDESFFERYVNPNQS